MAGDVGPAPPTIDFSLDEAPAEAESQPSIAANAPPSVDVSLADRLTELQAHTRDFDFFAALRRLECMYPELPRFGTASRPSEEPLRVGQEPDMGFAPSSLHSFTPPKDGKPARLSVLFQGFFGPNGALPLHITEYARERKRNANDSTFASFADVFHHRMMMLFYRAWSQAQPVVSHDRPDTDRFATYVGALFGGAPVSVHKRHGLDFRTRMFFAGHMSGQTKHPDGLACLLTEALGVPAQIEEFTGEWVSLPPEARWRLGHSKQSGFLGQSATLGSRAWMVQHKFRVALGPFEPGAQRAYLPGTPGLARVSQLVGSYVGDELRWDLKLKLKQAEATYLGRTGHLGWSAFLAQDTSRGGSSLVLEPQRQAAAAQPAGA